MLESPSPISDFMGAQFTNPPKDRYIAETNQTPVKSAINVDNTGLEPQTVLSAQEPPITENLSED